MRRVFLFLLICLHLAKAHAQAHPDCAVRPPTLAAMRSCCRPLLVFAPSATDTRLLKQQAILDEDADDMMDRNVLLVPLALTTTSAGLALPLDTPYTLLPAHEVALTRRRFQVAPGAFAVILLGEDGSEKLRSSAPIAAEKLNSLIDTMPTRKHEVQQPHAN